MNVLLNASQLKLEKDEKLSDNNIHPFEMFLKNATILSNSLSSMIDWKKSWKDLQKIGEAAFIKVKKLYDILSQELKRSLKEELYIYDRYMIISIILYLVAIIFVLSLYSVKAFRRPLWNLQYAVENLTAGNLSARVHTIDDNEVGIVSNSFNATAEVFEKSYMKQIASPQIFPPILQ